MYLVLFLFPGCIYLIAVNFDANSSTIYNFHVCSICMLNLHILHQKLSAAKSCMRCIPSAEGNALKLEVAVIVSETFAVQCSLHTWCQVRGCAIFSKQFPYKNSVADFIRLLYVAKK